MTMKLAAILERKGPHAVTVTENSTISDAINLMDENRVGSVMIATDDNELLGIFTERDVLSLCANGKGGDFQTMLIKDHMTTNVIIGHLEDHLDDVLGTMTSNRFRRLPVVVGNKIVGLLSLGDLVKAKLEEVEHDADALREYIAM
jgi:CBS domain-containing protein